MHQNPTISPEIIQFYLKFLLILTKFLKSYFSRESLLSTDTALIKFELLSVKDYSDPFLCGRRLPHRISYRKGNFFLNPYTDKCFNQTQHEN